MLVPLVALPPQGDGWLLWGGLLAACAAIDVVAMLTLLSFHTLLLGHDATTLEIFFPPAETEESEEAGKAEVPQRPSGWCAARAWCTWLRYALRRRTCSRHHYCTVWS